MFEHVPVVRGRAAEEEVAYLAADGGRIPNLGEQRIRMKVDKHIIATIFQVADVTKPVLSVTKLTEDGNEVRFNRRGGTISDPRSGKTVSFVRRRGVYVLEAEADTGLSDRVACASPARVRCGSGGNCVSTGGETTGTTTFQRQGR